MNFVLYIAATWGVFFVLLYQQLCLIRLIVVNYAKLVAMDKALVDVQFWRL